ncbi:excinuclease ABC subunit C [Candidatus Omnitrophus magneticus]|uniref:Excinuclease ABC subunit C n=1 Tax=Candidatus Omnitrophus magneticus TaxID=1609969 RepID=A0A0F0CQB6_9BACT|nr:excinuclease ABC subunit C [Candidatus Omnitrophus magneticus]
MNKSLFEKIKNLPESPGVYIFLNSKGDTIYVGKAKVLKRRVSSYFQASRARDSRLELLISEIDDIKFITATSEVEAFIYEAGLIKDYKPRFNIELKDDKSYPFLSLTINEKYPRLIITRDRKNDGTLYFGPYTDVKLLRSAISFMKKIFPLRTCVSLKKKVCLEYHIGLCSGPCENKISKIDYDVIVSQLRKFLEGKKNDLINLLENEMRDFSKQKEYEKALAVKKRIEILTIVSGARNYTSGPVSGELEELKAVLDMSNLPLRIECFDISNIQGARAVGSMVKFIDAKPCKKEYRLFKIKTVKTVDDYSMMREVVHRRYSRLLRENALLPSLILIDGGKGHLAVVKDELDSMGIKDIPLASIAKEFNHIYVPYKPAPIRISRGSLALLLIQRIRDEAHRFAVTYHRKLRNKKVFETNLLEIKGIGKAKERFLLEKFGDIASIKNASLEDLEKSGLDKNTARRVFDYFSALPPKVRSKSSKTIVKNF